MSTHELFELKAIVDSVLLPIGFELRTEEAHPEAFGSYWCDYSNGDVDVRFIWDGKDGQGYLEAKPSQDYSWTSFGTYVREDRLESMKDLASTCWPSEITGAIAKYAT